MLGTGFSHTLGQTLGRVVARGIKSASYIKDNLKIYFDFKSSRAKTLEFVGTGSAYFNGTNAKVVVSDDDSLDIGINSFSVSAWIYHEEDAADYIVNKIQSSSNNPGWRMIKHSSDKILFGVQDTDADDGSYVYGDVMSPTINAWYHIVCTVDRSIEDTNYAIKVYVDGVDSGNAKGGVTLANVQTSDNSGDLIIGTRYDDAANRFTGKIKNVGYWKRVLSPAEIQNIMYKNYSDLKGSELTHLLGWWALESDANDSTGNNNGTATNVTFNSTNYSGGAPIKPRGFDNAPTAQADLIGSGSASLNGTSGEDHIAFGASEDIVKSVNTTYVCWVKRTDDTRSYLMSAQRAGVNGSLLSLAINQRDSSTEDPGEIAVAFWNGSSLLYVDTEASVVDKNKWHHIAAVMTASTQKIYVDGVLVGSDSQTFNVASPGIGGADEPFTIGAFNNGSQLNAPMNIAQAAVYNEAMTQEKIQTISQKTYIF